MADSRANGECLRNPRDADRQQREAETPEKRARLDQQKGYREKRKASETELRDYSRKEAFSSKDCLLKQRSRGQ